LFNVPYDGTGREPVDARLIAKAPQLAGALDEVTAIVETLLVHYGDQMSGEDSRAREHAADSARELLAEIRGEEAPAKEVPAGMNLRYRFGSSSRGFPER
jgi:hypothetical protein